MTRSSLYIITVIAITITITVTKASYAFMDTAKVTVRVVDESGKAIYGARVGIGFEVNTQKKEIPSDGFTNSEGRFTASEKCNGYIGFKIEKSGYYMSHGQYIFQYEKKGFMRWEPWNPEVTVILRKIENPVPMYARDSTIEVPVTGKDIGFDLIMNDFVGPYGLGKHSDFVLNLFMIDNGGNDFEYQLKIKFPTLFDGIQTFEEDNKNKSIFRLPRIAPIDGYKRETIAFLKGVKRGASHSWKDNRNYIFRIRSEVEKGKLKKAMYGKILRDIEIANPIKKGRLPTIHFKYYLNPDYTRNLEYDPTRNLFTNLKDTERVGIE